MKVWRAGLGNAYIYIAVAAFLVSCTLVFAADDPPVKVRVCPIINGEVKCPPADPPKEEKPPGAAEAQCPDGVTTRNVLRENAKNGEAATIYSTQQADPSSAGGTCIDCFPVMGKDGRAQEVCIEVGKHEEQKLNQFAEACGESPEACKKALDDDRTQWRTTTLKEDGGIKIDNRYKTFFELGVSDYSDTLYDAFKTEAELRDVEGDIVASEQRLEKLDAQLKELACDIKTYNDPRCGATVNKKLSEQRFLAERTAALRQLQEGDIRDPDLTRRQYTPADPNDPGNTYSPPGVFDDSALTAGKTGERTTFTDGDNDPGVVPTRTSLEEADARLGKATEAYNKCNWWFNRWLAATESCESEETELAAAKKGYSEAFTRERTETTATRSGGASRDKGDLSRLDAFADKNMDNFLEAANKKTPSDDPIKKWREEAQRLRRENDAALARRGGRTTPSGDGWSLLLFGDGNTNPYGASNSCTAAMYQLCVAPPHSYQACMACSQSGPGGQSTNPIMDLVNRLLGRNQNNPAVNNAMCGAYPGTQFVSGRCECPTGTQWVSASVAPAGAMPAQPTYPQGYPYASPYTPYPTGSCQQVNVCAQYPGTQFVNNQCTCPSGQQWTGQKCEAVTTPQEQIKAELSCSAKVVDAGKPLSLSWSCAGASTSRGDGFDTGGVLSGSKDIRVNGTDQSGNPVPPFRLTLTCIKEGRAAQAQCPAEINRPAIVASAVLSIVPSNATTSIGWLIKGGAEGEDICTIMSDKHPGFSVTGRNKVVETPAITEHTKFAIRCKTRGNDFVEAVVPVVVKN